MRGSSRFGAGKRCALKVGHKPSGTHNGVVGFPCKGEWCGSGSARGVTGGFVGRKRMSTGCGKALKLDYLQVTKATFLQPFTVKAQTLMCLARVGCGARF